MINLEVSAHVQSRIIWMFFFVWMGLSCTPQRQHLNPYSTPYGWNSKTLSPPPVLNLNQLLGLQRPPNLIRDKDSGQFAQRPVMENFWKLKQRAAQDGWHLILVSGYRSFNHQRHIWNHFDALYQKTDSLTEKDRARAVMSLVSVPGLSRHHWGTDLDISEASLRGQLVNVHPETPNRVLKFYDWMEKNAPLFGFCKVYLGKKGAVRDEPWHWSFVSYSIIYQEEFMSINNFKVILNQKVANVNYLMKNFPEILRQEIGSINSRCFAAEYDPNHHQPGEEIPIPPPPPLSAPQAAEGAD